VGGDDFFTDPDRRLLRSVDIEEIEQLRATHQPSPSSIIPKGLYGAVLAFLVGATARKIENPTNHYAFLCHVSMNKKDHEHIVTLIEKFKENALNILQSPGTQQYEKLIANFKEAYEDLGKTQVGLPAFDKILERIMFYLRGTNVKLINATSREEIKLDAVYNIFVGGNKLGRGVTIENLLVSYYGRNPKNPNSDTVLQHARMYGYRQEDLGVTRLFLPDKLAEHFALIHDMENALRDLVEKYPEGKFEILYISSPLQATRRNVLDPDSLVAYVAGESVNPSVG
jgi:Z1 domain